MGVRWRFFTGCLVAVAILIGRGGQGIYSRPASNDDKIVWRRSGRDRDALIGPSYVILSRVFYNPEPFMNSRHQGCKKVTPELPYMEIMTTAKLRFEGRKNNPRGNNPEKA